MRKVVKLRIKVLLSVVLLIQDLGTHIAEMFPIWLMEYFRTAITVEYIIQYLYWCVAFRDNGKFSFVR